MVEDNSASLRGAIRVDDQQIRGHIDEAVRSSVEETLNALLDAEADQSCRAQRYERSADRRDTRAGHYERKLETKAGEVKLRVPKLRSLPFETAIIERHRRREASVEEALVEMYLAGKSVRRVEDITEALWGTRVSSGTVSRLNQKIYRHIEAWRNRTIEGEFPYVYRRQVRRGERDQHRRLATVTCGLCELTGRKLSVQNWPRPGSRGGSHALHRSQPHH
jgi:putative transposase